MSQEQTELSRRSLLSLIGSRAAAAEPKELMIIPGAVHTDLYDRTDIIPFEKITAFFTRNL